MGRPTQVASVSKSASGLPDESLTEPGRDRDDGYRAGIGHPFLEAGGNPEPLLVLVDTALHDAAEISPRRKAGEWRG
jgi:hypothetical protein